MIYTVTCNPSLDYTVTLQEFRPGMVNRTEGESIVPGGKGINVSIMLQHLGHDSRALGFIAGFTGAELERLLHVYGCHTDLIDVEGGMTRINVKLKAQEESDINGQGPHIQPCHFRQLLSRLESLQTGDILVLAGSISPTLPPDMYEQILSRLEGRHILTVVDATRDLLRNTLRFHPFLVKPNHHELAELFGVALSGEEEIRLYAGKLRDMGARNVLVSMAGDGAMLLDEQGEYHRLAAPRGKVINSVGAGDSMVAGFLAGWLETGDYGQAFRMGLCAGSASAFQDWLAGREEMEALLRRLEK